MSLIKRFFLRSLNYTLSFSGNGNTLKVPVINNVGRANLDLHEEHMRTVLERIYTPGTLLIDVGANIGQTLIKYALLAGPDCHYVGFEPNLKAAAYVDEIIIRNTLVSALVIPVGLGAGKGMTELLMASAGSTDPAASINPLMRDSSFYAARKVVAVTDGDSAVAELDIRAGPMIIKIDVEGGEVEVIQGFTRTLAEFRPLVIMEILPPANFTDAVNNYRLQRAEELRDMMSSRQFSMFSISVDGKIDAGPPTADYLFVPNERAGEFRR